VDTAPPTPSDPLLPEKDSMSSMTSGVADAVVLRWHMANADSNEGEEEEEEEEEEAVSDVGGDG
jgi:hypothetical protein